jgi:hypothetical protein
MEMGDSMFVPHVAMHHRRGGRKPTPRQRLAGFIAAAAVSLVSVLIGTVFSKGSRVDATVLACIAAGLALVVGIVLARVIGRQGRT